MPPPTKEQHSKGYLVLFFAVLLRLETIICFVSEL